MSIVHSEGFSTSVRLQLLVDNFALRVAQVGEDSLILREVREVPANTPAKIVITVDGEPQVYPILLREGIRDRLVSFENVSIPAT